MIVSEIQRKSTENKRCLNKKYHQTALNDFFRIICAEAFLPYFCTSNLNIGHQLKAASLAQLVEQLTCNQ
jgi:hypothetical protein